MDIVSLNYRPKFRSVMHQFICYELLLEKCVKFGLTPDTEITLLD